MPAPANAQVVYTFDVKAGTPPGMYGTSFLPTGSPNGFAVSFVPGFGGLSSVLASNVLTVELICVAAGTPVQLASGEERAIEDVRRGDAVVDADGRPLRVEAAIALGAPTRRFVSVPRGVLGERALLICRGHPVLLRDGGECPAEAVPGARELELGEARRVYTLVTARRSFVEMAGGALVGTWSRAAWDNFVANDPRARGLRFTTH